MRGTALPSSIPHPHVPGWSGEAKVLPRHHPAPAGHRGLLPRLTRTLLLHSFSLTQVAFKSSRTSSRCLEAEVAVGWQLPILYRQHISPTYSQLRENTS